MNRVADHFNKRGKSYSKAWVSTAKKRLSAKEIDIVKRGIELAAKSTKKRPLKTLDIGVGTGRITREIIKNDVSHFGIDVSNKMIEICTDEFRNNKKVQKLQVHDIVNPLPASFGTFDMISAIRVLSYTPQWKQTLQNVYSALNPGGVLVFTFPNKYSTLFLSRMRFGKDYLGVEASVDELNEVLTAAEFTSIEMAGFNRLPDILYDLADTKVMATSLFLIEDLASLILGRIILMREFYIICKK